MEDKKVECPRCDGSGIVWTQDIPNNWGIYPKDCPMCEGKGEVDIVKDQV